MASPLEEQLAQLESLRSSRRGLYRRNFAETIAHEITKSYGFRQDGPRGQWSWSVENIGKSLEEDPIWTAIDWATLVLGPTAAGVKAATAVGKLGKGANLAAKAYKAGRFAERVKEGEKATSWYGKAVSKLGGEEAALAYEFHRYGPSKHFGWITSPTRIKLDRDYMKWGAQEDLGLEAWERRGAGQTLLFEQLLTRNKAMQEGAHLIRQMGRLDMSETEKRNFMEALDEGLFPDDINLLARLKGQKQGRGFGDQFGAMLAARQSTGRQHQIAELYQKTWNFRNTVHERAHDLGMIGDDVYWKNLYKWNPRLYKEWEDIHQAEEMLEQGLVPALRRGPGAKSSENLSNVSDAGLRHFLPRVDERIKYLEKKAEETRQKILAPNTPTDVKDRLSREFVHWRNEADKLKPKQEGIEELEKILDPIASVNAIARASAQVSKQHYARQLAHSAISQDPETLAKIMVGIQKAPDVKTAAKMAHAYGLSYRNVRDIRKVIDKWENLPEVLKPRRRLTEEELISKMDSAEWLEEVDPTTNTVLEMIAEKAGWRSLNSMFRGKKIPGYIERLPEEVKNRFLDPAAVRDVLATLHYLDDKNWMKNIYNHAMRFFKTGKTAYSPATHIRNMIGASINSHLATGGIPFMPPIAGMKAMAALDGREGVLWGWLKTTPDDLKMGTRAMNAGMLGVSWDRELRRHIAQSGAAIDDPTLLDKNTALGFLPDNVVTSWIKGAADRAERFYRFIDEVHRVDAFIKNVKRYEDGVKASAKWTHPAAMAKYRHAELVPLDEAWDVADIDVVEELDEVYDLPGRWTGDARDLVSAEDLPLDHEAVEHGAPVGLWHVTTARDKVVEEGLRPRGVTGRVGLGGPGTHMSGLGGGSYEISITYDENRAALIESRLRTGVAAARGDIGPDEVFNRVLEDINWVDDNPREWAEALGAELDLEDMDDWDKFDAWLRQEYGDDPYQLLQDMESHIGVTTTDTYEATTAGLLGTREEMARIDPDQIELMEVLINQDARWRHLGGESEIAVEEGGVVLRGRDHSYADHPLAKDIEKNGIKEPIVFRQKSDGSLMLEDGAKRLAAARMAGFDEVPIVVRRYQQGPQKAIEWPEKPEIGSITPPALQQRIARAQAGAADRDMREVAETVKLQPQAGGPKRGPREAGRAAPPLNETQKAIGTAIRDIRLREGGDPDFSELREATGMGEHKLRRTLNEMASEGVLRVERDSTGRKFYVPTDEFTRRMEGRPDLTGMPYPETLIGARGQGLYGSDWNLLPKAARDQLEGEGRDHEWYLKKAMESLKGGDGALKVHARELLEGSAPDTWDITTAEGRAMVRAVTKEIDASEVNAAPLWRGGGGRVPQVGEEVDLGPFPGFSPQAKTARKFGSKVGGKVVYRLDAHQTRALNTNKWYSGAYKEENEFLVRGKFKVTKVVKNKNSTTVHIEAIEGSAPALREVGYDQIHISDIVDVTGISERRVRKYLRQLEVHGVVESARDSTTRRKMWRIADPEAYEDMMNVDRRRALRMRARQHKLALEEAHKAAIEKAQIPRFEGDTYLDEVGPSSTKKRWSTRRVEPSDTEEAADAWAATEVNKFMPTFIAHSQFGEEVRKYVPFSSFTTEQLRIWKNVLTEKPHLAAFYNHITETMSYTFGAMAGFEPSEIDAAAEGLPWFMEGKKQMVLPFKVDGRPRFLDMSYLIPLANISESQQSGNLFWASIPGTLYDPTMNPLMSIATAAAGWDPFAQRQIEPRFVERTLGFPVVAEGAGANRMLRHVVGLTEHIASTMLPPWVPPGYTGINLIELATGARHPKTGEKLEESAFATIAGNIFGMRTYASDVESQILNIQRETRNINEQVQQSWRRWEAARVHGNLSRMLKEETRIKVLKTMEGIDDPDEYITRSMRSRRPLSNLSRRQTREVLERTRRMGDLGERGTRVKKLLEGREAELAPRKRAGRSTEQEQRQYRTFGGATP